MTRSPFLLSLGFLLSALACSSEDGGAITTAKSELSRELAPQVTAEDSATLARDNQAFAGELYAEVAKTDGNLFLSPHSISTALAMTYAGARGATSTEMAGTLHYTLLAERLHPAFNQLDLEVESRASESTSGSDGKSFQLSIANALFGRSGLGFEAEFLDTLAVNYGAGMSLVDFGDEPAARAAINDWVSEKTKDKIPQLIDKDVLSEDTALVLVNAIYFLSDWQSPFEKQATSQSDFTKLDGSTTTVDMMHQVENFSYIKGDGYAALTLPYVGDAVAMTVVLPDAEQFATVEANLDGESFASLLSEMVPTEVSVALPKWTFESSFELSDALKSLGMPSAFGPDVADFSGMTTETHLFIDAVIHKAFVAVDEEGTEAAAATAVEMSDESAPLEPEITFQADRPFLFFIHDVPSSALLFMGRLVEP
jgi:serpin B